MREVKMAKPENLGLFFLDETYLKRTLNKTKAK